ncbi:MAG: hypothetical protein ACJAS9_001598 [Polaribacter sp.]|jgi:hypothetical protein
MSQQIVKIEFDEKDDKCLQITLRKVQKYFWRKKINQLSTYKGYGRNWYTLPEYEPAPSKVVKLLRAISQDPQYKHLRLVSRV